MNSAEFQAPAFESRPGPPVLLRAGVSGKQSAGLGNPLLRLGFTETIRILFFPALPHRALITVSSGKIRAPGGSQGLEESVNE